MKESQKMEFIMYREFLKRNNPVLFIDLVLSCQFWTYLVDINV